MNGIDNSLVFYPLSILLIIFAILTVCCKNIFHSLLCAILVFFLTGVLFYVLGSEYNAIIQIAIYGLAVPVILGLAIMFTNPKNSTQKEKKEISNFDYTTLLIGGIFAMALVYLVMMSLVTMPDNFIILEHISTNSFQTLAAISNCVFVKYVWAFEILSVILTITIIGLTIFKHKGGLQK